MVEKPSEPKTTAARAATPTSAARRPLPVKPGVGKESSSEIATLVYAVSVAVALGIACGAWINARLASAASIAPPAPSYLLPAADANVQKKPETSAVTESQLKVHDDNASTSDPVTPSHVFGDAPEAETPGTDPAAENDRRGAGKRGAVAPAPLEREAGRPLRDAVRPAGAPDVEKRVEKRAAAVQGRAAPCAQYASAGSLTIRSGGVASLVVGGPGEAGRVTVTTLHWSDIAVFAEGRAGGNGWVRYSVRSVSKKPGLYTVRFTTPCGSQTVPVTVTRQ